ncbi:hypothetical protein llap_18106 [Limosa lapponica baueri]|uniref:Uncharacterized protein n=1 Tax=Limosa lapponica baueri TaxID=1758121 RepID=A0A2I0TCR4_LIMLA|nr:hypothetical protein llap_18106 [Limosa lapponica baueri]
MFKGRVLSTLHGTLATWTICLKESDGIRPWLPRKLVDTEGSPSPSSRAVHPNEQEVKQKRQEACVDEQGVPGQTQAQKGSMQKVEARMVYWLYIQRHCLNMQG